MSGEYAGACVRCKAIIHESFCAANVCPNCCRKPLDLHEIGFVPEWQPMTTAPKTGTVIKARRIWNDVLIYEGPAQWRTVHFAALPRHPIDGDLYAPAENATGWIYPRGQDEKRVPEPTEWQPAEWPPA